MLLFLFTFIHSVSLRAMSSSLLDSFDITLIIISCISTLFGLIITIRVTHGWLKFFKEYSNIIKKQLFMILLSFIFYPIIVTLYCCFGSIDLILIKYKYKKYSYFFSTISLILWLFVLSSFFVFRIIRLIQSDRDKNNNYYYKKYTKESLILLFILNILWILLYFINKLYIKILLIILILLNHLILFILCQKSSISIWLNRDPLKYIYIEKEPLYSSLLSQMQCKKLVFQFINVHFINNHIPKCIKQLCFKYTFIDQNHRETIHNNWQLLHGRKLKKDKIKDLKSISKLLFIEIITGIGMFICSILYLFKILFIYFHFILNLYIIQFNLYLFLILTLTTFAMFPTFNSIFYERIFCKCIHNFVEKRVLKYLEIKYKTKHNQIIKHQQNQQNHHHHHHPNGPNNISSSNHISRILIASRNSKYHKYDNAIKYDRDDTIYTQTGLSNIITELHLESKQKPESTIHESHSIN